MKHWDVVINLIKESKLEVIGEIGVWKGHLLQNVLSSEIGKNIKEYWAIDPYQIMGEEHGRMGKMTQKDWDQMFNKVSNNLKRFNNLRLLRMTSERASEIFPVNFFDFVYLDACHFYDFMIEDIQRWSPLIKKEGFLAGDGWGIGESKGHKVKEAVLTLYDKKEIELYPDSVWVKQIN